MGIFKELVLSAPVNMRLPFGVVENVRVLKIDTGVRKREGLTVPQNTFVTLAQYDPETGKIIAQSEGAYWNLDHTKDFVMNNFIAQFTSLLALAVAYGESDEEFDDLVTSACPSDTLIDAYIRTKDGAKALQESLKKATEKFIVPHVGPDSTLMKCKSVVNKKGYFELGSESNWILPMDSKEDIARVTPVERRIYRDSLKADLKKKAKPDLLGEKSITTSTPFGL